MARRNWATRIWTNAPLTGNANSVFLGSPDPSTTLCGTNHTVIEMNGHFDKVQLIFGAFSIVDDVVIAGCNAIVPNTLVGDKKYDADFATAASFTFSGLAGVTIPKRSGTVYPNIVLTDPLDISSVDRVDVVGAKPLLAFRIKLSLPSGNTNQINYLSFLGTKWDTDGSLRYCASSSGDWLTGAFPRSPASNSFGCTINCLGIRYLARKRAATIIWVGDSITACAATTYTTHKYGGFPLLSANNNTTLDTPVEHINSGMSTYSATNYQTVGSYVMPLVYPTHLVEQFLSPNTLSPGSIASGITTCINEQSTIFTNANAIGVVRAMWGGIPECTSSACTSSVYSASEDALRVSAMETQAALGYPNLNLNDVIKTNTTPQLIQSTSNGYPTNYTGDGLHPNQAADDEQLTPTATTFIASLLSSYLASFPTEFEVRIPGGTFFNGLSGSYQVRIPGGEFIDIHSRSSFATMGGPGRRMSMGLMIGMT